MNFQLIAFSGPAGVGKSTAAQYLVERHGFKRMSFADPLRDMLRALGLTDDDFTQEGKARPHPLLQGKTPRQSLQSLGTEWGRQMIGPEIWKEAAMRRAYHAVQMGQRVVFDDCRFDNEAQAVLNMCGLVIELHRPEVARLNGHASEAGVRPELVSFYLDAYSVEDLHRSIETMLSIDPIKTEGEP